MSANNLEQPQSSKPVRILALCDSPVVSSLPFVISTGFGRVARNILEHWASRFSQEGRVICGLCGDYLPGHATGSGDICTCPSTVVHCYAISFDGWGYEKSPVQLYPAGRQNWNSPAQLQRFLQFLVDGGYTHLWMLMDPHALSVHNFPAALKKVCREHNIRSLLYYPVDSPLEREWLAILDAVDVAVTYTEYGRNETRKALKKSLYPVEVIPHGVDEIFRPLPMDRRGQYRKVVATGYDGKEHNLVQDGDFLMLNVNKNEWRKDPLRSLEILKGLRDRGIPAKLILRMHPTSAMGGPQLEMAAQQLGLTFGKEWCHIGDVSDENLCGLYNAADLYLTTSMGEGWGLGVTEAMACHCPVAMAKHTSFAEIGNENTLWLPLEEGHVCGADTRLRRRVELNGAVEIIAKAYGNKIIGHGARHGGYRHAPWGEIAVNMFNLLMGKAVA